MPHRPSWEGAAGLRKDAGWLDPLEDKRSHELNKDIVAGENVAPQSAAMRLRNLAMGHRRATRAVR